MMIIDKNNTKAMIKHYKKQIKSHRFKDGVISKNDLIVRDAYINIINTLTDFINNPDKHNIKFIKK